MKTAGSLLLLSLLLFACRAEDPAVARGRALIVRYRCLDCHAIPGAGTRGAIGPSLDGVATRPMIGRGRVQNTRENLERYLMHPSTLNPGTAMPGIGDHEEDARDIAAYLMTLR